VYSRRQLEKALWVLQKLAPKELQSHKSIRMPVKVGKTYTDSRGYVHYAPVLLRQKVVGGTGIPASTIHKFQRHEIVPRERSIKKLSTFYDKYMYNVLRSRGANKENARTLRSLSPELLQKQLVRYDRWARQIQRNHRSMGRKVDLMAIKWSMAHSSHGINEWDILAMTSGLQKYHKKSIQQKLKRARKYEH
jgi:hypothetical protein